MAKKEKLKKKRILYPWMKKKQGRAYKAMLAFYCDSRGFNDVLEGKTSFGKYLNKMNSEVDKIFPSMFIHVSKYYEQHGRKISIKDFRAITLGRLRMMFSFKEGKIIKLKEHPINCSDKFSSALKICKKLLKRGISYDAYSTKNKSV